MAFQMSWSVRHFLSVSSTASRVLVRHAGALERRTKESTAKKAAYIPKAIALRHMDNFYAGVFGRRTWRSIRLALHAPEKSVALVNNYGANPEAVASKLREDGCVPVEDILEFSLKRDDVRKKRNARVETILKEGEQDLEEEEDSRWRLITPEMGGLGSPVLMDFVPATELKTAEDEQVSEEDYFKAYPADVAVGDSVPLDKIRRLPHFRAFGRPYGDVMPVADAWMDSLGTLSHLVTDAASLLPSLALEMSPGDNVLYVALGEPTNLIPMMQTMLPEKLTVFVPKSKDAEKLRAVVEKHVPQLDNLSFEFGEIQNIPHLGRFDKVMIEPLCTVDRRCIREDEDNIFHVSRVSERVDLPHVQAELVKIGLGVLKEEGHLVYTTSTLSPVQNDGVILAAFQKLNEDMKASSFFIRDLRSACKEYESLMRIFPSENGLGMIVAPFLPNNFGPRYFVRVDRRRNT